MHPGISVVIPVHNASALLDVCLREMATGDVAPWECIVVDDGSTDDSALVAERHGATVLSTDRQSGPARARNLGARAARGDLILFLDADVIPAPDTLRRVRDAFAADPTLDALLGSYDDCPSSPGFVSQYKNLMHCFVHRNANRKASTFWSGCGAIRREVFFASGGFDESYDRPAMEDIELGYRLVQSGHSIVLDPKTTVTHQKHWTLTSMIHSDMVDRGIPWTELIWRDRVMPNDLNLRTSQRASVALMAFLLLITVATVAGGLWQGPSTPVWRSAAATLAGLWACGLSAMVLLNRFFFAFLRRRRGIVFALGAVPLLAIYFLYSGLAFAIGTARYALHGEPVRAAKDPLEPLETTTTARTA